MRTQASEFNFDLDYEVKPPADDQARPLRILHVGKYFHPHRGGMETYLRDLMNVQRRAGLEVMGLVHSSRRRLHDETETFDALNGREYQVVKSARWFTLGFVPICPLFIISAYRAIHRFKPDIIHLHLPNASPLWMLLLPSARKIRWVCSWHSDVLTPIASRMTRLLYALYRPLERLQLKQCERIFASSPPYAEHSEPLQAFMDKVVIQPLALDSLRLPDPDTVEPLERGNQPLVLTVGRMAVYKGHLDLINAVAETDNLELWIAGTGELETEIKALIKKRQLEHRVRLWGAVNDGLLWRLYKTCDLFCLASTDKTEAFGMVLLEAAHFHKPILVNDIEGSGVPWVGGRICGLIAPKGSVGAILNSLLKHYSLSS